MLALAILVESLKKYVFLGFVTEPLALLVSGVGLVGATFVLRRVLKRRDERIEEKIEIGKTN